MLLTREELHVEPRPGERRAVDGAERTGADDDGAFLAEDAHAPLGLEHEASTRAAGLEPAVGLRRLGESVGGGDAWRDQAFAPASSRRACSFACSRM